jgi:hypothetical protein
MDVCRLTVLVSQAPSTNGQLFGLAHGNVFTLMIKELQGEMGHEAVAYKDELSLNGRGVNGAPRSGQGRCPAPKAFGVVADGAQRTPMDSDKSRVDREQAARPTSNGSEVTERGLESPLHRQARKPALHHCLRRGVRRSGRSRIRVKGCGRSRSVAFRAEGRCQRHFVDANKDGVDERVERPSAAK